MSDNSVLVFSSENSDPSKNLNLMGDGNSLSSVELGKLKKNVRDMQVSIDELIDEMKSSGKSKGLEEVTVAVSVNAKGAVGFLGTGAEAGASATFTLKFKV